MKIFKYLYLNNSVFYGATIVAIAYILAFFFPILMSFASILLLVLALFTFVDVLLLFLTKVPLKAQRILPEKLSNGDENFVKIDVRNLYDFNIKTKIIDEIPFQFQKRDFLIEKSIKNNWTEIDKKQVEITLDEGTNYLALEKPVENASIEELPPTKVQL